MFVLAALLIGATGASSGPDLSEKAQAVVLPITDVAVFSDRARVTRSGAVSFSGGPQVLKVPDLPGAAMADTVRVSATGSNVIRVETRPVERERWSIDQVDSWIAELEVLSDQMALAGGKLGSARAELALLSGLQVAPPVAEKDRVGKPTSPEPAAWKEAQDRLGKRRSDARVLERELERELRALATRYEAAQREVQQRDIGGYSDQKLEVLVIVDGAAGNGRVSVEYAVPGAFWKPAYDLSFDPDAATVELKASGLVTQATGEDWPQVKLALSTAIPGQGIDLPTLRTWTLGDDREFVPVASARSTPRTARPFLPPAARPRLAELERDADRALLATRTEQLMAMAQQPPASFEDGLVMGSIGTIGLGASGVGRGGGGASSGRAAKPSPPRASSRKTVINFDDEDIAGDMASPDGSYIEQRSRAPSSPPMPARESDRNEASISSDRSDASRMRRQGLALVSRQAWQRPTFSDPLLPAVSAGGLDYVYDAPVTVTIPSEANGLRVPLAVRTYAVQTFYEATPSLATTAYLKASVKNGSKLPILAGPANVFVKGTFSGDAQLTTTGPGGALELPLGADEDIRLTRTVVPATRTQGVFFEEDVTDYTVTIEVGNYKKRPVTIRVVDQLPKTNAEKLKVEMITVNPKPRAAPDGDGLLYWHVDVPAGGVAKVAFTYRITRPKNWKLSQ